MTDTVSWRIEKKSRLIDRLKDVFAELTGKNRFGKPDFVLLKTMMMLAARYPQGAKFDQKSP